MYGKHDCGFEVFPRQGVWSFQRVHEILSDCQDDPTLVGATINTTGGEGGFSWPGTKDSEALWRINTQATTPPSSSNEYGPMQIRTYGVRGVGTAEDDWRSLRQRPDFETPCHIYGHFTRGQTHVPAFHCRAKHNAPLGHVVALMRLFQARGHTVCPQLGSLWTPAERFA